MSIPIVERVFGTSDPYTESYLQECLNLVNSIVIKSDVEATTYNDLVAEKYGLNESKTNRKTWRYYKHLIGEYHKVDRPMKIISRDTKEEITITKKNMEHHIETREELCKFSHFFREVVNEYPEQEMLLKVMISNSDPYTIDEILELPRWSIAVYNKDLVEPQEDDLIFDLEQRIFNYAYKGMKTNYMLVDSLYLAGAMINLTSFMIQNLKNIREGNIKSYRAHSYHVIMYLASHHGLDVDFPYMDPHQRMWLYREMKFLNSHAGRNDTFKTLIEKLFTRKRISVSNYIYNQYDNRDLDRWMEYGFTQELLNDVPLLHDEHIYSMEELASKEIGILNRNSKVYEFDMKEIDYRMKNSQSSQTLTKDLEINLIDSSNEVKHPLINILIDYWAVTIQLGYNNTLIDFIDPITGKELFLDAHESFKLWWICILRLTGAKLTCIPDFPVNRAFSEKILPTNQIAKIIQRPLPHVLEEIEDTRVKTPSYRNVDTRRSFRRFIESIYRFELGMSIYLDSTHRLTTYTDYEIAFEAMHQEYVLDNSGETYVEFIERLDFKDFFNFGDEELEEFADKIMNFFSDNLLEFNEINRLTQKAMTHIFSKFRSYTVQVLSEYESSDPLLTGLSPTRFDITGGNKNTNLYFEVGDDLTCIHHSKLDTFEALNDEQYEIKKSKLSEFHLSNSANVKIKTTKVKRLIIESHPDICISSINN